jgi:peptidoglycan hydrolase CwlO-like protein
MPDPERIEFGPYIPGIDNQSKSEEPRVSRMQMDFNRGVFERVTEQAMKISNHEGQLSVFSTAISAAQSSLSSWSAAVWGFGGIMMAGMALIGAIEFMNTGRIDNILSAFQATNSAVSDIQHQLSDAAKKVDATNSDIQRVFFEMGKKNDAVVANIDNITKNVTDLTVSANSLIASMSEINEHIENLPAEIAKKAQTGAKTKR